MSVSTTKLRVTILQISAGQDVQANLARLKHLLDGIGTTDVIARILAEIPVP